MGKSKKRLWKSVWRKNVGKNSIQNHGCKMQGQKISQDVVNERDRNQQHNDIFNALLGGIIGFMIGNYMPSFLKYLSSLFPSTYLVQNNMTDVGINILSAFISVVVLCVYYGNIRNSKNIKYTGGILAILTIILTIAFFK